MQNSTNRSRQRSGKQKLRLRLLRLQPKAPVESLKTEDKATRLKVKASKVKFKAARSKHAVFVESKSKKANTVRPITFLTLLTTTFFHENC